MKPASAVLCVGIFAILLMMEGALHAQIPPFLYRNSSANNFVQTGAEHYLQQITLTPGPTPFVLQALTISVNVQTATTTTPYFVVQFYTGLDTSSTSADVLANAQYVGSVQGTVDASATGNYTTTTVYSSNPVNLGNNPTLGAEVYLFSDNTFTNYATNILNGRFTPDAPTVGTSQGYVWNDSNLDNTFTGAEKTTFGQSAANIRFSITGVPEPGTYALCGVAGLVFGGLCLRRRNARA